MVVLLVAGCTSGSERRLPGEWLLRSVNGLTPENVVASRVDLATYGEAAGSDLLREGEWIRETRLESIRLIFYPEGDVDEVRVAITTDIVSPEFWRRNGVQQAMPAREVSGPDTTRIVGTWLADGDSIRIGQTRGAMVQSIYEASRVMAAARGFSPQQLVEMETELLTLAEEQAAERWDEGQVRFRGFVEGQRLSGMDLNGLELVFRKAGQG